MPATKRRISEIRDTHGEYELVATDDRDIPDGREFAPDLTVTLHHRGVEVKRFAYPTYRIWTLMAHWKEGLDA